MLEGEAWRVCSPLAPSRGFAHSRRESGGCVAERARVPGRFAIATEAVSCVSAGPCERSSRTAPLIVLRATRARAATAEIPRARTARARARSLPSLPRLVPGRRAVHVFLLLSSVTTFPGPAIVARCKEAATVNPCVSGCVACVSLPHGVCRSPVTIFRKLKARAFGIKMNELRNWPGSSVVF